MRTSKVYVISEIGQFSDTVVAVCQGKDTVLNSVLNTLASQYGARDYYEDLVDDGKEITFITSSGDIEIKITQSTYYSIY